MTKIEQMLARASKGVSSTRSSAGSGVGFDSLGVFVVGVFFFVILGSLERYGTGLAKVLV
jgi:hypothetical protein